MIGIQEIATQLAPIKIENKDQNSNFDMLTITEGLGFTSVRRLPKEMSAEELCIQAFRELQKKFDIDSSSVDFIGVISQQIHVKMPNIAAIIHDILDLPEKTLCMDFGLGCAGYVQGLLASQAIMEKENMKCGLLFNVETLSQHINDSNRQGLKFIFSDAATVTLLSDHPILTPTSYSYGTLEKSRHIFDLDNDFQLTMNGLAVYNFAIRTIPKETELLLKKINLKKEEIDLFCFHQAGKKIVNKLQELLNLPKEKVPFDAAEYGNTGSCTIPFLLEPYLRQENIKTLYLSGYGSGVAWANAILKRTRAS